jgi:hypothetical protein
MIKVNPIPQSISFIAPARAKQHRSAHLSATGGGLGNPVVFSVGGPGVCTVSGSTVTYTAAGNCVIDANQAGNARYADASQVQRTIKVSKLSQSITFFAPSAGTIFNSASLSAIDGGSGNPVVLSVDPSSGAQVCALSGTVVTFGRTGTCVIDANQAGNDDYTAAPQVQRTIAVTKTPQNDSPGGEVS